MWGAVGGNSRSRGAGELKRLGSRAGAGESPVSERHVELGPPRTRVPRDTRNPAGSRGDHPPRLAYTWPPIVHEYREGKVKSTPQGG